MLRKKCVKMVIKEKLKKIYCECNINAREIFEFGIVVVL